MRLALRHGRADQAIKIPVTPLVRRVGGGLRRARGLKMGSSSTTISRVDLDR
jgi:hypothetical protein